MERVMTPCDHKGTPREGIYVPKDGDGIDEEVMFCRACGTVLGWSENLSEDEARTAAMKWMVHEGIWGYCELPNGNLYGEVPQEYIQAQANKLAQGRA